MEEENIITPGPAPEETPVVESTKKSFSIHYIIELILLAGLVILYVLHFTAKPKTQQLPLALSKNTPGIKTVFVNIDTLNARYEFVKVLSGDLESTGKKMQNEVLAEQDKLEKEYAEFQKQVQSNSIPEDKARIKYEELMMRQQTLMDKKQRYTQQVADKELKMHQTLLDTVTNFLKRYNRDFGYDYILGYSTAGEILLANDTLDITRHVLNALNEEYSKSKGK